MDDHGESNTLHLCHQTLSSSLVKKDITERFGISMNAETAKGTASSTINVLNVFNKFEKSLRSVPKNSTTGEDRYKLDVRQHRSRRMSSGVDKALGTMVENVGQRLSQQSRNDGGRESGGAMSAQDRDEKDDDDDNDNDDEDDILSCHELMQLLLSNRPFVFFMSWLVWLILGTVYYSIRLELNFSRALYMAVNVGYSIGWGDILEDLQTSQAFSTFYVIVGASFIGAGLGFFAEGVVAESGDWYLRAQKDCALQATMAKKSNYLQRAWVYINFHWDKLRGIVIWLLFLIIGTIFAAELNNWTFITALYFAVSTMSTGGLVSLPENSPDYSYLLLGLYAAFGIPIMGVAMASLAGFFIEGGDANDALEAVTAEVTEEEILNLNALGLEDGDGALDKAEYIILILLRLGNDPELISFIEKYFRGLDKDGSGTLSLEELRNPTLLLTKQALELKFRKRAEKLFSHKKKERAAGTNASAGAGDDEIPESDVESGKSAGAAPVLEGLFSSSSSPTAASMKAPTKAAKGLSENEEHEL